MSLHRFVYYSAVIGGWAALLAWLACEVLFLHRRRFGGIVEAVLTGACVGAIVGAGLNAVAGMSNAQWKRQWRRLLPGLLGGGIGGASGGLVGSLAYSSLGLPRAVGWMIMGLGIGASEGAYERSGRKLRNGLIGGAVGGLLGGMLFDPIRNLAPAGLVTSSRATAFVLLGISIGALIGLAHVVLKEAWLTVVDGFRPGRQLILSQDVTVLGRGDHLPLPFLGYSGKDLESEHLRIVRQPDGSYLIEDNHSRLGTRVNGQLIQGPVPLADDDLVKLGTNIVRFNHRRRSRVRGPQSDTSPLPSGSLQAPPPPAAGVPSSPGPGVQAAPSAGAAAGVCPVPAASWIPPKKPAASAPPGTPAPPPRIPPPPPPPGGKR